MFRFLVLVLALSAAVRGEEQATKNDVGRIVGGSTADIKNVPYQLSLSVSRSHVCGASLISAEWAVTAAHCTVGRSAAVMTLLAGTASTIRGGQVRGVNLVINHPKYNRDTADNDISLLRTVRPFTLDTTVQPVVLPAQGSTVSTNTYGVTSGWGATFDGGSNVQNLRQVSVPVVDRATCNASYSGRITNNMICVGYAKGGKDACQGDSGGPFVVNGRTLVGIVSWGRGCARPNLPGVYTRTSMYRDWIKTNSGV